MATTTTKLPEPEPTPGYEITRHEVRQFMRAAGLDPDEVLGLQVVGKRVVAIVAETGPPADPKHASRSIVIRIRETR